MQCSQSQLNYEMNATITQLKQPKNGRRRKNCWARWRTTINIDFLKAKLCWTLRFLSANYCNGNANAKITCSVLVRQTTEQAKLGKRKQNELFLQAILRWYTSQVRRFPNERDKLSCCFSSTLTYLTSMLLRRKYVTRLRTEERGHFLFLAD